MFTEEKEINWLGSLTKQARGGTGDAWHCGPGYCLAKGGPQVGPCLPDAAPETRICNLGVFGEAEPGMSEKHPGVEGFMFVVGESLSKPLLSPAQQLKPLTLGAT